MRKHHPTDIPGCDTFTKIEPINKGWSGDKKYYIETADGARLLLRVADIAEHDRVKAAYEAAAKAAALGTYMPQPHGFGLCGGGKQVYYLVSWLEGEDVMSSLKTMPDAQRYALGKKAGALLRKLHTLPAPVDAEPWADRFARKLAGRLSDYQKHKHQKSKAQIERCELAIAYLEAHADLLKTRQQTFNHGDFNTSNIIRMPNGEVGAIDFNCFNDNRDYGDPLFDMILISYLDTPDPQYYSGLWNGYAGGAPDRTFFEVTAYYFAYDAVSSLGGNRKFDNGNFDKKVLEWYDNFNRVVPAWYRGPEQHGLQE